MDIADGRPVNPRLTPWNDSEWFARRPPTGSTAQCPASRPARRLLAGEEDAGDLRERQADADQRDSDEAERVDDPTQLGGALDRCFRAMANGRPYLVDVRLARRLGGADSTWYDRFSIAKGEPRMT